MRSTPFTEHVALRLKLEQVTRIDAQIPRFSTPWRKATRSDVVRALVLEGLSAAEKKAQGASPARQTKG